MSQKTRAPTGDSTVTGTVSGSLGTRYQAVDDYPDTVPADYLEFGTTTAHMNFTYTALDVPAGVVIDSVQVKYYDYKVSGTQNCGSRLVTGTVTPTNRNATTHTPATSYTSRTDTWANNPVTGIAWTIAEVNGTSGTAANNLVGFGTHSTDSSPIYRVSCMQLVVNYHVVTTFNATGTLSMSGAYSHVPTSGFEIQRKLDAGSYAFLAWKWSSSANSHADTDSLVSGHTYTYKIRQYTAAVPGAWSNEPSVAFSLGVVFNAVGTLVMSGTLTKSITKSFTGTLASVGAFVKTKTKAFDGTLVMSGAFTGLRVKIFNAVGTLVMSGTFVKTKTQSYVGTLASSGTFVKSKTQAFVGTLASSGVFKKTKTQAYAGTLASSGAFVKTKTKAFAGTLAMSGTFVKSLRKSFSGTLSSAGTFVKGLTKPFTGTLSTTGVFMKSVSKNFSGTLSSTGTFVGQFISGVPGATVNTLRRLLMGVGR